MSFVPGSTRHFALWMIHCQKITQKQRLHSCTTFPLTARLRLQRRTSLTAFLTCLHCTPAMRRDELCAWFDSSLRFVDDTLPENNSKKKAALLHHVSSHGPPPIAAPHVPHGLPNLSALHSSDAAGCALCLVSTRPFALWVIHCLKIIQKKK